MFDVNFPEWASLILRWLHITAGIAWIGSSFYFMYTDASLRPDDKMPAKAHGETWQVHGGGFYHIRKYLVSPDNMPATLHWFKLEAYFTWISGFFLLSVIYYLGADTFLVDRNVMDLTGPQAIFASLAMLGGGWVIYDQLCKSPLGRHTGLLALLVFLLAVAAAWAFTQMFSGRAAYVHAGVLVGTIMVGNVFFIIIPNQKKVVKALIDGQTPDPALGKQAKQRSVHNNYLTLPVLLMMISNHYPMTYGHAYSWFVFAVILIIGGLVRHYHNCHNAGQGGVWVKWLYPSAAALMVALILFVSWKPDAGQGSADAPAVEDQQAFTVIRQRCSVCHSSMPTWPGTDEAPAGVMYDSLDQVLGYADRIRAQAVDSQSMPPGNATEMTEEERRLLGIWLNVRAN